MPTEVKDPGKLRHRGTIEAPVRTQGNLGQAVITGRTVIADRIPLLVEELAGRDLEQARQLQADVTIKVTLRWRPGILTTMRLVWHDQGTDRTLSILAPPINPDGKRFWLELMCKEPK
jgi:head-tail adaptor